MGTLPCALDLIIGYVLRAFTVLLLIQAVTSWVPSLRGNWTVYVDRIVNPVLAPVERFVPPVAGLSLAFLIVFIAAQYGAGFFIHESLVCRFQAG